MSILGGQCNSGHVVARAGLERFCPEALPIRLVRHALQGGTGAMDQQGAQHDVTALADGAARLATAWSSAVASDPAMRRIGGHS